MNTMNAFVYRVLLDTGTGIYAANFVKMSRELMFSILSIIVTYQIILVQFSSSEASPISSAVMNETTDGNDTIAAVAVGI